MCTVTFTPLNNKIFITHNRDEKNIRARAIPPKKYNLNGYKMLFPKDRNAGGSWIAINENGSAAVLLNGGFIKHIPVPPYRKSRGLVFLEIAASNDMLSAWQMLDLHNIEPFTLILWNHSALYECRWNGSQKYTLRLDSRESHIWSSTTLYEINVIEKRKTWFTAWRQNHPSPSLNEIIHFHLFGGEGDVHNDLLMNRDGITLTVSITGIEISAEGGIMKYFDLQDDRKYRQEIKFSKVPVKSQ